MLGFVKLPREILEEPVFDSESLYRLWSYLLLQANHKARDCIKGESIVRVKKGQLLTSKKSLANRLGYSESKIHRMLCKLQQLQKIEQHPTSQYRIITVLSYDKECNNEPQMNSRRTTNEPQMDSNNNGNNYRNKIYIRNLTLEKSWVEQITTDYKVSKKQIEVKFSEFVNYNIGKNGENCSKTVDEWFCWFKNFCDRGFKVKESNVISKPEELNTPESKIRKAHNLKYSAKLRHAPLASYDKKFIQKVEEECGIKIDVSKKLDELLAEYRD